MFADGRLGTRRDARAQPAAIPLDRCQHQFAPASSSGGTAPTRLAERRRSLQSVDIIGFTESAGPPSGKSIWQFAGEIAKIGTVDATRTALGGISAAARSTHDDSHLEDLAFEDGFQVDGSL